MADLCALDIYLHSATNDDELSPSSSSSMASKLLTYFILPPPPHRTLSLYTIHSTDNEFVPHLLHEKSYWYQFRFRFLEFNMQTKHTDFSTCIRSEGGQKTKQNEMKWNIYDNLEQEKNNKPIWKISLILRQKASLFDMKE